MTLITNSLEYQLSESFYYCGTSTELWQEIKNQHNNQKSHSQIYHLKQEITKISHESRNIPTLITHIRVLQETEEMDRIYTFLAALEPSYEPIRAQILLSTEKLSFETVTAQIRQEVLRRVAMSTPDLNPKPKTLSFSAQHLTEKVRTERCSHCKREGHS
jgi:hypothetical protein